MEKRWECEAMVVVEQSGKWHRRTVIITTPANAMVTRSSEHFFFVFSQHIYDRLSISGENRTQECNQQVELLVKYRECGGVSVWGVYGV